MSDDNDSPTIESPAPEKNIETEAAPKRPLSLLASETYGKNFVGEVEEAANDAIEEAQTTDAPTETAAEIEEDLAAIIRQNLDADPTLLARLKLTTKIDGESGEATLEDLIRSYQTQTAAEKRLEDAKVKAKQILEEASSRTAKVDEQFAVTAKLIEKAEAKLSKEIKEADLAQLRRDDPSEWSARMREIDQQRAEINQMKLEAVGAYRQSQQATRSEMETALAEHIRKEHAALLEKKPDWADAEKAKAGKAKVAGYLVKQGFTQDDVARASDHRLVLMAEKAMLFDELQANTNAAKKKLATVPKVLRPGTTKAPDQINRERVSSLESKLRKTGSIDDAFALLKAQRGK
jgi:hypothetical protein